MPTERSETRDSEFAERWTTKRLVATMPGTTRKWWKRTAIPELVRAGVLRKMGNGWIGRRSDIETALMTAGGE